MFHPAQQEKSRQFSPPRKSGAESYAGQNVTMSKKLPFQNVTMNKTLPFQTLRNAHPKCYDGQNVAPPLAAIFASIHVLSWATSAYTPYSPSWGMSESFKKKSYSPRRILCPSWPPRQGRVGWWSCFSQWTALHCRPGMSLSQKNPHKPFRLRSRHCSWQKRWRTGHSKMWWRSC